jgi:hypothetical protein
MKTTQTFSILIWANKSKAINTEAPLFARITVDGKRAEVSLKKRIELSKWDPSKGCMKGTSEDVRTINNYINWKNRANRPPYAGLNRPCLAGVN